MKHLPKEDITFHTQLSANKVLMRLRENMEKPQELFTTKGLLFSGDFTSGGKKYQGYIEHNEFNISRILNSDANSLILVISGKVSENEKGTTIDVEVKLHLLAYILFGLIMVWVFVDFLSPIIQEDWSSIAIIFYLFSIPLFVFGALKLEARQVKKSFTKLFDAQVQGTSNKRISRNSRYKK